MKKLLALLFVVVMATAAPAAVQEFDFFTADLPEGWTTQKINDNILSLVAPDKLLAFTVMRFPLDGGSVKAMAEGLAARHGADDMKAMEGDGEAYEYSAMLSGAPTYVQVFGLGDDAVGIISISGDHESDLATEIFNAIEF